MPQFYPYLVRFTLLTAILITSYITNGSAQDTNQEDPLKKPKVWERLLENPSDLSVWSAYLGKPWVCMSYYDKENIKKWRTSLRTLSNALATSKSHQADYNDPNHHVWDSNHPHHEGDGHHEVNERELALYNRQLEEMIEDEPEMIADLKDNITANFLIIEDIYREEFIEFGVTYQEYSAIHPDGKYSQEKWIEDKNKELLKLRKERLNRS